MEQPGQITWFVASLSTVLSWLLAGQRGTTTENSNIRVCAQPSVVFYTAHVKKIGSSMSRRWGKMSGIISIVLATCCGSTPNVSAPVPYLTITLRSNVIEMEGAPESFETFAEIASTAADNELRVCLSFAVFIANANSKLDPEYVTQ